MITRVTDKELAQIIKEDAKLLEVVALARKTVKDNPGNCFGFFSSVKFKKQFFAKETIEHKVFSVALEYAFFRVDFLKFN